MSSRLEMNPAGNSLDSRHNRKTFPTLRILVFTTQKKKRKEGGVEFTLALSNVSHGAHFPPVPRPCMRCHNETWCHRQLRLGAGPAVERAPCHSIPPSDAYRCNESWAEGAAESRLLSVTLPPPLPLFLLHLFFSGAPPLTAGLY